MSGLVLGTETLDVWEPGWVRADLGMGGASGLGREGAGRRSAIDEVAVERLGVG